MTPIKIETASKTTYHVAAVMACNYLVALLDASTMLAEQAGIERTIDRPALKNIAAATLNKQTSRADSNTVLAPIDYRAGCLVLRMRIFCIISCEPGRYFRAVSKYSNASACLP